MDGHNNNEVSSFYSSLVGDDLLYRVYLNPSSHFANASMSTGLNWTSDIMVDGDDEDDFDNKYFDEKNSQDQRRSLSANMNIGYFLTNGLLAGLKLGVTSFKSKYVYEGEQDYPAQYETTYDYWTDQYIQVLVEEAGEADYEYTSSLVSNGYNISPFMRYYASFGENNNNAAFIEASVTLGSSRIQAEWDRNYESNPYFDDDDDTDKMRPLRTSKLGMAAGLSLSLFQSDNDVSISLEPAVNFSTNKFKQELELYDYDDDEMDWKELEVSTKSLYFSTAISVRF